MIVLRAAFPGRTAIRRNLTVYGELAQVDKRTGSTAVRSSVADKRFKFAHPFGSEIKLNSVGFVSERSSPPLLNRNQNNMLCTVAKAARK